MSTAAKSKSRDKKVVNESQKTPSKASSGSIGGAYNPLLGTFQTVESTGSTSLHSNCRFKNIDESDSNCDSASNNGSWSGDSEDHKEKPALTTTTTTAKQETIPGADNDKREKMRLKNERKHQRQKEKRAQELHERCCQFLMSRKLEVLAQQIIPMGISHEDATYALMLNEGKLQESVNWLFDNDGANLADKKLVPTSGNLKLDISQELSRILELETKYKCSKQDVEKAVVTAEGDIEKAEESLRRQKQEQSTASIKVEDIVSNSASASRVPSVHTSQSSVAKLQPNSGMYHTGGEVERKNLGYPRGSSYINGESGNHGVNPMDKINMKMELMKMQQNNALEEKKRMAYQHTPLPRPTEETHYVGDQFKRLHQQEMREPVMLMHQQQLQRSQSAKANVLPVSTMNPSFTVAATAAASGGGGGNGWYPVNRSEAVAQSNGYLPTRTLPPTDLNPNLVYQQLQYQQYQGQVNNGHRMVGGSSPHAVSPAASLGLFSGYGSTTPSSGVEWSTDGSVEELDYNNIDWSLDRGLACPRPNQQQQYVEASPYETNMNGGRTRMMGNGNGMGMTMGAQEAALVGNGREWTSPFEGKDLFSLSRQYVPPSL